MSKGQSFLKIVLSRETRYFCTKRGMELKFDADDKPRAFMRRGWVKRERSMHCFFKMSRNEPK